MSSNDTDSPVPNIVTVAPVGRAAAVGWYFARKVENKIMSEKARARRKPASASVVVDGGGLKPRAQSDLDLRLQTLAGVLEPMARALGENAELVLHDYRNREHSVVAVAGSVTHRAVGGAMSEIGLSVLAEGDAARDRINYVAVARGRIVRSSTIVLRDGAGHVFGALCINTDVTAAQRALRTLTSLVGEVSPPASNATFANDIHDVIDEILRTQMGGRDAMALTPAERVKIFQVLDGRGVFNVRHSITQVAAAMGVSRATGYVYLEKARMGVGGGVS